MKKYIILFILLLTLTLSSCTKDIDLVDALDDTIDTTDVSEDYSTSEIEALLDEALFDITGKEVDFDDYDDYSDSEYTTIGIASDTFTITEGGVYVFDGIYNQTITVNAPDQDVEIVLVNAYISVTSGPAILVLDADDVTISVPEGTTSYISDTEIHPLVEDEDYNSVIYSLSDIEFNGTGTLDITANYNNAIYTKDDAKFSDLTLKISSVDDGIIGKDYVAIKDATIEINADGDGIASTNEGDDDKGFVYIKSGTLTIDAGKDAIQSENDMIIYDGDFTLTSGDDGLQSNDKILIGGGTFEIDATGDAINSVNDLVIYGGDFTINTDDDALHSDNYLLIEGGTILVESSYEGLEAYQIDINGGTINVTASDDGINATTGGTQEHGPTYVSTGGIININGGIIQVNASGDGVDANGNITMTDGYLIVYGPTTDMQAAIDYDETFTISGGFVVALGSSAMALPFTDGSTQASILYVGSQSYKAGTTVSLVDQDDQVLVSLTALKSYASVLISTEDMLLDQSYTLSIDGDDTQFTTDTIVTTIGYSGEMMPGGTLPARR